MKFKKYIGKFDPEKIKQLSSQGMNIQQIAEIVDIPYRRLGEMIKEFNLDISKGFIYKTNDEFFDKIDSEEKAYLLGFFIADGCMQKEAKKRNGEIYSYSYRMSLNNSVDDSEIIETFCKYICPSKDIEYKNSQKGVKIKRKLQNIFRWNSKHMFETLESYNIHPRKTYDSEFKLPDNVIPKELMRHFVRGFFDGDGHKGECDIQFCFNSKYFMEQIFEYFKDFNHRFYEIQGKTCTYYKAHITGGKSLLDWVNKEFYNNSNLYLTRKYILFNSEVTTETKESVAP